MEGMRMTCYQVTQTDQISVGYMGRKEGKTSVNMWAHFRNPLYVYMCVCVCMYVRVCVYLCMYVFMYEYVCIYVYM
jgi:hypothetical protein